MKTNLTINTGRFNNIVLTLIIIIASLFSSSISIAQQTFSYTQYMNNLTPLNPAYSLLSESGTADALVRKQWAGIPGAPTTFLFNGSMPVGSISNSSAGLVVRNDNFAVEHFTEVNAFFAKGVQLGNNQYLGVSISAGIRWYKATYSTLDPNDPALQSDINETKANFGFGIIYYSDKYYLAASVPELTIRSLGNASVQDNNNFRNHYYFAGAFILHLADDIDLKPAALASYSRGVPFIGDLSATFILKNTLGLGIDARTNSDVAGIVSYSFKQFRFGYGYQFATGSLNVSGISNATNEVTLRYRFGSKKADWKTF